jgi:hypothetical protein
VERIKGMVSARSETSVDSSALLNTSMFSWFPGYSGLTPTAVVEKLNDEIREDQLAYNTDPSIRQALNSKWKFLGGSEWPLAPVDSLRRRAITYILLCDMSERILDPEDFFEQIEGMRIAEQFRAAAKRKMLKIDEYWYLPMRNHPKGMLLLGVALTLTLVVLSFAIHPILGVVVAIGLVYVQVVMWSVVRLSRSIDPYQLEPSDLESHPLGMPDVYHRWQASRLSMQASKGEHQLLSDSKDSRFT